LEEDDEEVLEEVGEEVLAVLISELKGGTRTVVGEAMRGMRRMGLC
jgi:hypothetical protein